MATCAPRSSRIRSPLRVAAALAFCLVVGTTLAIGDVGTNLKDDEKVTFFPTFAHLDEDSTIWNIPSHGWVFEPEEDSTKRKALLGLLSPALGLEKAAIESAIFRKRARLFLVDNERGKKITIRLRDAPYELDQSGRDGHFETVLRIPVREVSTSSESGWDRSQWLAFKVVMREGDPRQFTGRVQLIDPVGLSVISDIDDTIKITNVVDRKALLANTFLREFKAVPGIAEVYQGWAKEGATFHYVSACPWQLYEPLSSFLSTMGFPTGSFHMKSFRWMDSRFFDLFASPLESKPPTIEAILTKFPRRRFILVGDSSEKDPEVYGALARKHADQILKVLIRNVTDEAPDSDRITSAFSGVPRDRWLLFSDAGEIETIGVLSKNSIAPEGRLRTPELEGGARFCGARNTQCALNSHETAGEFPPYASYAASRW